MWIYIFAVIITIVPLIFMVAFDIPAILVALIMIVLWVLLIYVPKRPLSLRIAKAEKRKRKKAKYADFYKICKEKGTSPFCNITLFLQIAKEKGMPKNSQKAYNIGRECVIEELKKEDNKTAQIHGQKTSLIGSDKYFFMPLHNFRQTVAKNNELLNRGTSVLTNATHRQATDRSWALFGGIADGIAGPFAGIATALEVQRENVARRERLEEGKAYARDVISQISGRQPELKRIVQATFSLFDTAGSCVTICSKPYSTEFEFACENVSFRESGTLALTVKCCKTPKHGGTYSRADGVVMAVVKKKGKEIGCGYITTDGYDIPLEGKECEDSLKNIGFVKGKNFDVICFPFQEKEFSEREVYDIEFVICDLWYVSISKLKKKFDEIIAKKNDYDFVVKGAIRSMTAALVINS